jgi:7,8-dihydroneopterin aldolase/epimerase/oxygenase
MECINLTGIRAYGYTGYLPEEQVLGQWFEVDVKLWLDISKSAKTDDIEDTIDYSKVIHLVQHLVKTSKFLLIERLVATIADSILEGSDCLRQVQVTLRKLAAPIPEFNGKISIELIKTKLDL